MLVPVGEWPPHFCNPFRSKEPGADDQPYLFNLCVREEFKRQGLGRMICEVIQELVHVHWQKNVMHLHVIQGNIPAENLYQAMGYKIIEEEGPVEETEFGFASFYSLPLPHSASVQQQENQQKLSDSKAVASDPPDTA